MRARSRAPILLVHGGCGSRRPGARALAVIAQALDAGYALLEHGGSPVEAVEAAVVVLESSGRFNAGSGAYRQLDGVARRDASIMDGRTLAAGAVAAVTGIRNPVRAARRVMDASPHVLLVGPWAERFARSQKIPRSSEPRPVTSASWNTLYRRVMKSAKPASGTVGAVAIDARGHVAAATSTGGITRMLPGRVGDSPLIGAGTYADDRAGAVSMTGTGETIIRAGLARLIAADLARGATPKTAGRRAMGWMRRRIGGDAGAIILSRTGAHALLHTTLYMACGMRDRAGRRVEAHGDRLEGR
ncbi:MAG: isoaspartyl peptidase/L-asparaginase family protein [Nitrospirota bacterium]